MTRPRKEVLCDCGQTIVCSRFTNTCPECGADYNMSGQHLAPRAQWGEETGESALDIINSEAAGFPEEEY